MDDNDLITGRHKKAKLIFTLNNPSSSEFGWWDENIYWTCKDLWKDFLCQRKNGAVPMTHIIRMQQGGQGKFK